MDLLLLGALFLVGLLADLVGRYTFLPRVSVLLLAGLLIGPSVIGLIPAAVADTWFPTLTEMALAMIGFLLFYRNLANVIHNPLKLHPWGQLTELSAHRQCGDNSPNCRDLVNR